MITLHPFCIGGNQRDKSREKAAKKSVFEPLPRSPIAITLPFISLPFPTRLNDRTSNSLVIPLSFASLGSPSMILGYGTRSKADASVSIHTSFSFIMTTLHHLDPLQTTLNNERRGKILGDDRSGPITPSVSMLSLTSDDGKKTFDFDRYQPPGTMTITSYIRQSSYRTSTPSTPTPLLPLYHTSPTYPPVNAPLHSLTHSLTCLPARSMPAASTTYSADNSAKKQTGDPRKRLEEYVTHTHTPSSSLPPFSIPCPLSSLEARRGLATAPRRARRGFRDGRRTPRSTVG
jgi:hypothetical protein